MLIGKKYAVYNYYYGVNLTLVEIKTGKCKEVNSTIMFRQILIILLTN